MSTDTHVEIEQRVHLVLDDGYGFEEFLCVHGSHHAIRTTETQNQRTGAKFKMIDQFLR